MTPKDFAARLNGRQYGKELINGESAEAAALGLVIVFGYSDDNVEVYGASREEIGAWEGTTIYFTRHGLLQNECDSDDCPHFEKAKKTASPVKAGFDTGEDYDWTFTTAIPHETFEILEDERKFCRGIVFALADVP